MNKVLLMLHLLAGILFSCQQHHAQQPTVKNGIYEVLRIEHGGRAFHTQPSEIALPFDTLVNRDEKGQVVLSTNEYVPLELDGTPTLKGSARHQKTLWINLNIPSAQQLKTFSARRVMKNVALVIDAKVISLHKIREAINGPGLQITRCNDNACEYLMLKMKGS